MERPAKRIVDEVLESRITGPLAQEVALGEAGVLHCAPPLVPLVVSALHRELGCPTVVAVADQANGMALDLECFLGDDACLLPGPGASGDWLRPYDEAIGRRLKASRAVWEGKVAVMGVEALMGGLPGRLQAPWPIEIKKGTELGLEEFMELLVEAGYQREYTVEGWGRFSLRGGILDIFPSTSDRPVRVEMLGDTVESLREFNVVTQRSTSRIEGVELLPAREPVDQGTEPLPGDTLLIAVDRDAIESKISEFSPDGGREAPDSRPLDRWRTVLELDTLGSPRPGELEFVGHPVKEFRGDLYSAVREWERLLSTGEEVFLLLDGQGQVDRALELWEEADRKTGPPRADVGSLRRGFRVPPLGISVFTSGDLLVRRHARRAPRRVSSGRPVSSYAELELDGYVVHVDQGIGIYRGLVSKKVLGVEREYLLVEYARGDRLYVPTSQLSKVQRYVGAENPTIHRLRGREWHSSRKVATRSAERTARELLRLYLERKSQHGYAFSPDTPWQKELEEAFPHRDTPDQARATEEVKRDMESESAMDRLICGDVGYGKTEVAVRSAMKCVMDSRQVAVLVPTTVLAQQHYDTFRERFEPFPVEVRMLSRFLSAREQGSVVSSLRKGETDIVVGTHRLLQEDVAFSDLGLLVVDEEQKFGVNHKEKLRSLKRNVDTLTLTATPIPRTLQMSLSGVRDISIIDTPPEDRHPVATYVGEYDRQLAGHALRYEAARGGQAFYVHNRVESIDRVASRISRDHPDLAVAVAHGQMDEDELEMVMLEFAEGMHDVLVCTTIIESGLDLPNVNTLVVERAERLGLAQLYQIRGRVGRAGRRAYAYLFYPNRATLSDSAVSRLAAISEMTPLGSGMRVAMRDLEIRGAGNLLGAEQSGHIEAVGFELYCQLLKEAVEVLKGEAPPPPRQASVELPVDAFIPDDYIFDQQTRVEEYRRLITAGISGTIDEYAGELADRFGELPLQVRQMLEIEALKYRAGSCGIESISMRGSELWLRSFSGEACALDRALESASRRAFVSEEGGFLDERERTLYLKLRLGEVKNRQEVLLKWLNLIIDDIIRDDRDGARE